MTTPTPRLDNAWVLAVVDFYGEKRGSLPTPEEAFDMLRQEYEELSAEVYSRPIDRVASQDLKEVCDVIYTAIGYALARGYDISAAFERVCASNMTKDGGVVDGKVQKGPGYVAPVLEDLV